ncbi:hypothetical protein CHS0354_036631 [Potamilus streckersoni]|uniref:Uncharacterized protein n=1 Tax=Potamilus streckersoni TaxID=2493646 RepID=A0AAE0W1B1_9BIVA|nr:hypothetical protein CHS0354_036631 [Potamilus streckersoni]
METLLCASHGNQYLQEYEILLDATQLLIDMRDLISADHGKKNKTAEVAAKLSEAVQPFARQLNRLNDTYTNIHVFHVVFEKCKSWYKNTLRSVTSYIFSENNAEAWKRLMLTHAKKHPAPRSDYIAILNEHLPTVVDSSLKDETTLLCHRVKLLLQLIRKDSISEKELSQVRAWEEDQIFINVDDSSEVIDSREDLSQLQNDNEKRVSQVYQNLPSNREYDQCDEYIMIPEMNLPISDSYFFRQYHEHEARNNNMNYESLEDAEFKSRDWKRQTHEQCTDKGSSCESSNTFMVKRRVRTSKAAQSKLNSLPKSMSSSDLGSHDDERFIDLSYSVLDQDSFEEFINSDYFPPEQSGVFDSVNTFLSNREISSNVQSDPAENTDLTLTKKADPKALMSTLLLKEKFSTQFEEQESIRFSQSSTEEPYALDLSDSSEDDTCPTVRSLLKKNLSDRFNCDPNVSGIESCVQQHEIINTADNTSSLAQVDTSSEHENYMPGDVREAQHSSGANYKSFSPQSINDSEMISVGSSRTEHLLKSNDWNNVDCMSLIPSVPVFMTRKGDLREHRNNNDLKPCSDSNKDVNSAHSSSKSNLLSLQENVRRDNFKPDQTNRGHLRYSDDRTRSKILTSPLKSEHSHVPYTYAYETDGSFWENRNAHMHVSHNKHITDSKLRRLNETTPVSFITADDSRNENVDLALLVRKLRNNLSKSLYDLNGDDRFVNDHLSYRLSRSLFTMNAIGKSILAKEKETLNRPYRNFEKKIPSDPEYNEMFECHTSPFANDTNGQLRFTGSRTNPYFCNWSYANNHGMGAFYDSGKRKCSGDTEENPPIRQISGQHYNQNEERISDKEEEMNDHVEEEIARKLDLLSLGMSFLRPK